MLDDSHCHLADPAFDADRDEVVARARAAGVTRALCILSADDPDEVARAAVVRAAWPDVRFAAGIHPHRAGGHAAEPAGAAAVTRAAVEATGALAVGEIGLDYHYDHAPRPVQQAVFEAQVALAVELGRPVVIHTREATADTLAVLRAARPAVRGVMHCFTGTLEDARQVIDDLDFYLSFSGILTFPRAESLRDVARWVPTDRLLVETDAPYLAPVPHRGKRNEPAWVRETAHALALVRGVTPEALAARLRANFDAFLAVSTASVRV